MSSKLLEALFRQAPVRWSTGVLALVLGKILFALGYRFRAYEFYCWVVRVSGAAALRRFAMGSLKPAIDQSRSTASNPFLEAYLGDRRSSACARIYTAGGGGPHDLFRDLIVLKPHQAGEKGVILLKYARTFSAVAALCDLPRLMERYTFVLEPCWSGYCDPSILMYLRRGHPVFIQCFTESDHAFIEEIGAPFVPLRMGPADWVDAEMFRDAPDVTKEHDVIMVANWAAHKRHRTLFRALNQIRGRRLSVLLIGFPWGGRTADTIRREARVIRSPGVTVEIRENLPHSEVARSLTRSRLFVFLSRKEGDNKALVEAMFSNVPAVVYRDTIGGAGSRINPETGVFAADDELAARIEYVLDHESTFAPRRWALAQTGSRVASDRLDNALRSGLQAAGEPYGAAIAEKINAPNLRYRRPELRQAFSADYQFVLDVRREAYLGKELQQ